MSQTTKYQQYKYTLRSMAIVPPATPNSYLCNNKIYAFPVPPDDAISIENLYLHLKVRFNSGISASLRKITRIGIATHRELVFSDYPDTLKAYDVNLSADADRYIDTKLDLSALLTKEAVNYKGFFDTDDGSIPYTYVYIELPQELTGTIGDLVICRMDGLYTTTGIR